MHREKGLKQGHAKPGANSRRASSEDATSQRTPRRGSAPARRSSATTSRHDSADHDATQPLRVINGLQTAAPQNANKAPPRPSSAASVSEDSVTRTSSKDKDPRTSSKDKDLRTSSKDKDLRTSSKDKDLRTSSKKAPHGSIQHGLALTMADVARHGTVDLHERKSESPTLKVSGASPRPGSASPHPSEHDLHPLTGHASNVFAPHGPPSLRHTTGPYAALRTSAASPIEADLDLSPIVRSASKHAPSVSRRGSVDSHGGGESHSLRIPGASHGHGDTDGSHFTRTASIRHGLAMPRHGNAESKMVAAESLNFIVSGASPQHGNDVPFVAVAVADYDEPLSRRVSNAGIIHHGHALPRRMSEPTVSPLGDSATKDLSVSGASPRSRPGSASSFGVDSDVPPHGKNAQHAPRRGSAVTRQHSKQSTNAQLETTEIQGLMKVSRASAPFGSTLSTSSIVADSLVPHFGKSHSSTVPRHGRTTYHPGVTDVHGAVVSGTSARHGTVSSNDAESFNGAAIPLHSGANSSTGFAGDAVKALVSNSMVDQWRQPKSTIEELSHLNLGIDTGSAFADTRRKKIMKHYGQATGESSANLRRSEKHKEHKEHKQVLPQQPAPALLSLMCKAVKPSDPKPNQEDTDQATHGFLEQHNQVDMIRQDLASQIQKVAATSDWKWFTLKLKGFEDRSEGSETGWLKKARETLEQQQIIATECITEIADINKSAPSNRQLEECSDLVFQNERLVDELLWLLCFGLCGSNLEQDYTEAFTIDNSCGGCGLEFMPDALFCHNCGNGVSEIKPLVALALPPLVKESIPHDLDVLQWETTCSEVASDLLEALPNWFAKDSSLLELCRGKLSKSCADEKDITAILRELFKRACVDRTRTALRTLFMESDSLKLEIAVRRERLAAATNADDSTITQEKRRHSVRRASRASVLEKVPQSDSLQATDQLKSSAPREIVELTEAAVTALEATGGQQVEAHDTETSTSPQRQVSDSSTIARLSWRPAPRTFPSSWQKIASERHGTSRKDAAEDKNTHKQEVVDADTVSGVEPSAEEPDALHGIPDDLGPLPPVAPVAGKLGVALFDLRKRIVQRWGSVREAARALASTVSNTSQRRSIGERLNSNSTNWRIDVENLNAAVGECDTSSFADNSFYSLEKLRIMIGSLLLPAKQDAKAQLGASKRFPNLPQFITPIEFCRIHDPVSWWQTCLENVCEEQGLDSDDSMDEANPSLPLSAVVAEAALGALQLQSRLLDPRPLPEKLLIGIQVSSLLAKEGPDENVLATFEWHCNQRKGTDPHLVLEQRLAEETQRPHSAGNSSNASRHSVASNRSTASRHSRFSKSSFNAELRQKFSAPLKSVLMHFHSGIQGVEETHARLFIAACTSQRGLHTLLGVISNTAVASEIRLMAVSIISEALCKRGLPVGDDRRQTADLVSSPTKKSTVALPYVTTSSARIPTPPDLPSFNDSDYNSSEEIKILRVSLARSLFLPILRIIDPHSQKHGGDAPRVDTQLYVSLLALLCQAHIPETVIGSDAQRLASCVAGALRPLQRKKPSRHASKIVLARTLCTLRRLEESHARVSFTGGGGENALNGLVAVFGGIQIVRDHMHQLRKLGKEQNAHLWAEAKCRIQKCTLELEQMISNWSRFDLKELDLGIAKTLARTVSKVGMGVIVIPFTPSLSAAAQDEACVQNDDAHADAVDNSSCAALPRLVPRVVKPPSPPSTAMLRPTRLAELLPQDERQLVKWAAKQHTNPAPMSALRRPRQLRYHMKALPPLQNLPTDEEYDMLNRTRDSDWNVSVARRGPDWSISAAVAQVARNVRNNQEDHHPDFCDTSDELPWLPAHEIGPSPDWSKNWKMTESTTWKAEGNNSKSIAAVVPNVGGRAAYYIAKGALQGR